MKAVVLAGGLGTRMGDKTKDLPKALVELNGKPLLEHVLLKITQADISDVLLITAYRGDIIKDYFGNGDKWNAKISYVDEETPEGMGPAVLKAKDWVGSDDFLLCYCDNIFTDNLSELVSAHKTAATLSVIQKEEPTNKAIVVFDGEKITGIHSFSEEHTSKFIDAGIMCLKPLFFEYLESNSGFLDAFNAFLKENTGKIHLLKKDFVNVNSIEDRDKAEMLLKEE